MISCYSNYNYDTKEWYEDKIKKAEIQYNIVKTALEHASVLGLEINEDTLEVLILSKDLLDDAKELFKDWKMKHSEE